MTLVASPAIVEVIDVLEREARQEEQSAQEKREAAQTLRKTFGLTTRQELTAPVSTSSFVPKNEAPATRSTPAADATPSANGKRSAADEVAERRNKLVETLRAKGPLHVHQLLALDEVEHLTAAAVHNDLQVLRRHKLVHSTEGGWDVVDRAVPVPTTPTAPTATVPSTPPIRSNDAVRAQLKARLLTEAFNILPDETFEIQRLVSVTRSVPGYTLELLRSALDELVLDKQIGVQSVGLIRRYRRKAA